MGSLSTYCQVNHGLVGGGGGYREPPPPGYPCMCSRSSPWAARDVLFQLEGCLGRASIRTTLWIHFVHRHVQDMIVVL